MGSVWRCRDRELPLGDRTLVMGIVNVTPDSFSDGGMFVDAGAAVKHGLRLLEEGADVLDVGGESTRPGSDAVGAGVERERLLPVIEGLRREAPEAVLSVDTRKAAVARDALAAGADVVNDIGAGVDPDMFGVVASTGAGMVLMHMKGEPKTMQREPRYEDVVREVKEFLTQRAEHAVAEGVRPENVIVDPGIGFGKNLEHNLALLRDLDAIVDLGFPVLVGASRKRFIGRITGVEEAKGRVFGTVATTVLAYEKGAKFFRVHDVRANRDALAVAEAVLLERSEGRRTR